MSGFGVGYTQPFHVSLVSKTYLRKSRTLLCPLLNTFVSSVSRLCQTI